MKWVNRLIIYEHLGRIDLRKVIISDNGRPIFLKILKKKTFNHGKKLALVRNSGRESSSCISSMRYFAQFGPIFTIFKT